MSLNKVKKNGFIKKLIFKLWLWDAKEKYKLIKEYLDESDKILDIGSGPGSVSLILKEKGFDVTPIDIKDVSFSSKVAPKLFDGKNIPFRDNSFDVALLLTVLHHTEEPENLVLESKRVAKNIIIIEDVYDNVFQKYLTFFVDSLVNLEFLSHPHNNKTHKEWENTFNENGFKIVDIQFRRLLTLFKQVLYLLSK